uniref:Uncharacterized protein n=1 Tax=Aegilops tauschii subsp. strangulata TaxID=200361 RepID=A0A453R0S1_AEGTS
MTLTKFPLKISGDLFSSCLFLNCKEHNDYDLLQPASRLPVAAPLLSRIKVQLIGILVFLFCRPLLAQ